MRRDDAAGEAFDKGARILGLGYLEGQQSKKSKGGNPNAVKFLEVLGENNLEFSFSGLKLHCFILWMILKRQRSFLKKIL